MNVRAAAVAGLFYPDNTELLLAAVEHYMQQASSETVEAKAIVAPHAGYQYSGPIAANAYQTILYRKNNIRRVVIFD